MLNTLELIIIAELKSIVLRSVEALDESVRIIYSQDKGWLVVWVLWHINLCRLFNAKSIFMQIVSSISNNSVYHESSSSSSCCTISMDIPDPLLPPFSIVHCFWQVLSTTSHISIELLYVGSSWSSCLCSSMWRSPQEYITYEFILTSPAVSRVSGSSNLDNFHDGL